MRSMFFACVLKVIGTPFFLVKWILKSIWFLTYGFVGLLYKLGFIDGIASGKKAYTLTSFALLICIVCLVCFVKNHI